ncbi:MAG TPA: phosphoribosylamine--glycine ligase [Patescibacteria group bacterium]|nr:phosphoribosylamine--glycine ligase [Patescibacteria group bacterium]
MTGLTILLLGSGGREHALAWKLSRSETVEKVYALPGNDGIAMLPKLGCLAGNPADPAFVIGTAQKLGVGLVVIGPEKPLEAGVADALAAAGIPAMGPMSAAARLESSKIFAKEFMSEFGIPTAPFKVADSYDAAVAAVTNWPVEEKGIVVKADGLAAGKGVVVTHDRAEALQTLHDFMRDPACTVKTDRILLEEKLSGKEVSAFALCDGRDFVTLGFVCDYKRVRDNDEGPNTGGMGGYAPRDWPSPAARKFVEEKIFRATLDGMAKRDTPFSGVLFAGLMIDGNTVNVIEFNTRFGDPETQILMPLIEDDIADLFLAAATGKLAGRGVTLRPAEAVHIVMASEGYPETFDGAMKLGQPIVLPEAMLENSNDNFLFVMGAKKGDNGWTNQGGRVLGVTALGATIDEARDNAYRAIAKISFTGAHWRKDIGR